LDAINDSPKPKTHSVLESEKGEAVDLIQRFEYLLGSSVEWKISYVHSIDHGLPMLKFACPSLNTGPQ
jgi:hypothetical protein